MFVKSPITKKKNFFSKIIENHGHIYCNIIKLHKLLVCFNMLIMRSTRPIWSIHLTLDKQKSLMQVSSRLALGKVIPVDTA